ncbi:MAG: type II toxin-antitoxin system HicB family antitoxin [bacterium]
MLTAVYKKVRSGYVAWIEEVPGVLTQGKSRVEARANLADALREFIAARRDATRRSSVRGSAPLKRERMALA